jgi:predicted small secreted protein
MTKLIVLAAALALAGCDTIGGIEYSVDSGGFSDKTKAVVQACATRMQDHGLDPIRNRVELLRSSPDAPAPFAILTNNATPGPDEQRAIDVWSRARENCQADARALIGRIPVPPEATQSEVEKLTSYFTDAWIAESKLRVALYSGQISYADFANQRLTAAEDALKAAERYAQDTDEENGTHDLENVEIALEPFVSL